MALNFPADPALNETYPVNGVIYTWDGVKWTSKGEYSTEIPIIPDENGNVIITGTLTVQGGTITGNVIQGLKPASVVQSQVHRLQFQVTCLLPIQLCLVICQQQTLTGTLSGDITVAGDVIND